MSAFIGIDPGVNGALAFYDGQSLHVIDMPVFQVKRGKSLKREIDALSVLRWLRGCHNAERIELALIEQSMPAMRGAGRGVSAMSAHSTGINWGVAFGCLVSMGWPTESIPPATWKRAMACPADKDAARKRASQLLPQHAHLWARAKDDGRAEASLIALYAERLHREQKGLAA